MMHRCGSSHGNMVGPCSCGLFHSQNNSFSMLFSNQYHHNKSFDESDMYPFASPSSSVDCTLSLGTPSTRLITEDVDEKRFGRHERRPSSCMSKSNFCWDLMQTKSTPTPHNNNNNNNVPQAQKIGRGSSNNGSGSNNVANNDPLLARRCANCDTTSTPLWRNGPRGPKSLCNACGIRFKKEERRATAANVGSTHIATASGAMDQHYAYQNNSWVQAPQKMPCFSPANEFRFIEDSDRDSDSGIPFLSWKLNVTDRPAGFVHDFTR